MAAHSQVPNGLVAVHIAVHDPAEIPEPGPYAADYTRELSAASAKYADISWSTSGAEPRWLDMDTSTCAVAINPSDFASHGADEFERFLSGAASRSEPALIIATLGNADDDGPWNVFSRYDSSVYFRNRKGSLAGKRLPVGAEVSLAPDLDAADRDLGLRLRNRPASAPWWAMSLQSTPLKGVQGMTFRHPEGELVPILVDSLGEPVVARWTPSDGHQIWYVIPDAVDWNTVLDWIVQRALPAHIPAALRRVRSPHSINALLFVEPHRDPAAGEHDVVIEPHTQFDNLDVFLWSVVRSHAVRAGALDLAAVEPDFRSLGQPGVLAPKLGLLAHASRHQA
ncbi:hypothetical protein ACWGCP_34145 [Streptomyces niveus]